MSDSGTKFSLPSRRPYLDPMGDVFRFRVALNDVEPAIWRVFDIPADVTLPVLSDAILAAMGWKNRHLHQFRVRRLRFGVPDPEQSPFRVIDERSVFIAALFYERGDECVYQYDFGDWWEHTLQMMDFLERDDSVKYPLLVDGARACPPEDCGGPHRYSEFLQSGERLPRFDPYAFDLEAARKRLSRVSLRTPRLR